MNIVYGCYPSFFSLLIFNLLVKKYKIPIKVLLLSTKPISIENNTISGVKGFMFLFQRMGNRFFIYQMILYLFTYFCIIVKKISKRNGLYSFESLCRENGIHLIKSENFNSTNIINIIESKSLFISMCLDQILKQSFIDSFKGKCINIHPSDLPDFRGLDSVFQFLISPEKRMGISLHKMTPVIDSGEIILKRFIDRKNCHLHLMRKFIEIGCDMVSQYATMKYNPSYNKDYLKKEVKYNYKSWPSRDDIHQFEKNNKYYDFYELIKCYKLCKT